MQNNVEVAGARAAFFDRAEKYTPVVAVDAEGSRYVVSTRDYHIGNSLFVKSSRPEIKRLGRALRVLETLGLPVNGGTFIDVGANIGTSVIPAIRDHGFMRAVACEPEPVNLAFLKLNLIANGLEREVAVSPAAIGDRDGEIDLVVYEHRSGRHEVQPAAGWLGETGGEKKGVKTRVRQVALDTLASEGVFDAGDATFLWIDAQGHEGQILEGATSLIGRGIPIALELDPEALQRHGGLELVAAIAKFHYSHFVTLDGRVRGARALGFDLEATASIETELDWLLRNRRFSDVLLVRNPVSAPTRESVPRRKGAQPAPEDERSPKKKKPDYKDGSESNGDPLPPPAALDRKSFLKDARSFTPVVATDLDSARFILPTAGSDDDGRLFVESEHPRLRWFGAVVSALDVLGLRNPPGRSTFLQVGAGIGLETVAALLWHGFAAALAYEADLLEYRLLKMNIAANDLETRVRAIRETPGATNSPEGVSLDFLAERGLMSADGVGLLWIEAARATKGVFRGAHKILSAGVPVLLHVPSGKFPLAGVVRAGGLAFTYSHFAKVTKPGMQPSLDLKEIESLPVSWTARRGRATRIFTSSCSGSDRDAADRRGEARSRRCGTPAAQRAAGPPLTCS